MRAYPWTREQHDLIVAVTGRPATQDPMRAAHRDDVADTPSPADDAAAQARRTTS